MRTREKVRMARKFFSPARWSVSRLAEHYNLLTWEVEDVLRWAHEHIDQVLPKGWVKV